MKTDKKDEIIFLSLLAVPIIWFALKTAPYMNQGLLNVLAHLNEITEKPFSLSWCPYTFKTLLLYLIFYLFAATLYLSTLKNYRKQEEYGSAKWANAHQINKKYADPNPPSSKLLSQNVKIGLNGKKHRRNLNTIVIGEKIIICFTKNIM